VGNLKKKLYKHLPKSETDILPLVDPNQEFYPYKYIWIYTYPEIALQNPAIQQNFQHFLQFQGNFNLENNNLLTNKIYKEEEEDHTEAELEQKVGKIQSLLSGNHPNFLTQCKIQTQ
jgi:hypothetical protein